MKNRKGLLMILDGWGHRTEEKYNAIAQARKPYYDFISKTYPSTLIQASGLEVGLPEGMMGNSEVGHLNLGAGRIVWQELTRISKAIQSGEFFRNPALSNAMKRVKDKGALHLMGLASNGGVHSYESHYFALLDMARRLGLDGGRVFFHAITDGRDTPPTSGLGYVSRVAARMSESGFGRLATVIGRFYSMDRDKRWDRVEKAYRAYTEGECRISAGYEEAVKKSYEEGTTDEFILPVMIGDGGELPLIRDGDSVIFFNFRADRAREITRAFIEDGFRDFARRKSPGVHWVCLTEYDAKIKAPVAFEPQRLANVFGEHLSKTGRRQLRIAETEKYAHVTFFFNGGVETPFPGEDRVLVPSPKVQTYDLKPEMSAPEVKRQFLEKYRSADYDFHLLNFANPDMVGHTGDMEAAVKAIEAVDAEMKDVIEPLRADGVPVIVTADHGNAELMYDEEHQEPHTAHTTNPVPLIVVYDGFKGGRLCSGGRLCDVLPTMAALMGIETPEEVEGASLVS